MRTFWLGLVVGVVVLGALVVVWLHGESDQGSWVQPVTLVAGVAGPLLTAVAAVAASWSARDASRTAREAFSALRLHYRPQLILSLTRMVDRPPVYRLDAPELAPVVRDVRVTWIAPEGSVVREDMITDLGRSVQAPGEAQRPNPFADPVLAGVGAVEVRCVDEVTGGRWVARVDDRPDALRLLTWNLPFRIDTSS